MKRIKSWLILIMSLILIVVGTLQGETTIVLNKAIKICFECIGVG